MMEIKILERLCHDQAISGATYEASVCLISKGFIQWPAPTWDAPTIAVIDAGECVAAINYSHDEKQQTTNIDFAFCAPSHPKALAVAVLAARRTFRAMQVRYVTFTHHHGNTEMEKLVAKLRLKPHSLSYRVAA
jgi:hypothetical protein